MLSLFANPTPHHQSSFSPIHYPPFNHPRPATLYFSVKGPHFACFHFKKTQLKGSSMCSRCMSEGDRDLEDKILEFMEKSHHPKRFPTKNELESAGRFDLVEDIQRRGGWFCLGWEDIQDEVHKVEDCEIVAMDFHIQQFKKRLECCGGSNLNTGNAVRGSYSGEESAQAFSSPSSSGRSLKIAIEEESGVKGILSRLQRQRNSSLGIDTRRHGHRPQTSSIDEGGRWNSQTSNSEDRIDSGKNGSVTPDDTKKGASYDTTSYLNHYTKPDSWKVWSIQRACVQITEFEAAEISYKHVENEKAPSKMDYIDESKSSSGLKEINQDEIQTRLTQLESELSSALQSLRFVKEGSLIKKGSVSSSNELQKLYDAWEFQENEVMHAKEKLRVIRAKLSILEGKRSLLIGKEKNIEILNQRRLEGARKALRLLRNTNIIWQNTASEVLLSGSYDGWTSQRKMEKSSSGIFSASLRLYPGRYEIKFIVDGIWRVDPLRQIVHNNGYENNLLIIT